ncbi:MAG: hypothetical protein AAF081_13655 [Actinomycetota bacterium]
MNEPVSYEIIIRGRASERLLARLADDFSIAPGADGRTRLIGDVRDASHLHGVINQLTTLAIEIVSFTPVDHPAPSLPTPSKETP